MKKNDKFEITIEDISQSGEGIGHFQGMTFFIKDSIPGDRVLAGATKLKKNYGYARVVKILEPSAVRIIPECPVAGQCGGCQVMCMDYQAQLEWKQKMVKERLVRIGGFEESFLEKVMEEIIGNKWKSGDNYPYYFRNKAQYPVQGDQNGRTKIGFYAPHSHRIVETESCKIGAAVFDEICEAVRGCPAVIPYEEETGKGLLRHVLLRRGYRTAEVMVCFVVNTPGPTGESRKMLRGLLEALRSFLDWEPDRQMPGYEVSLQPQEEGCHLVTSVCVNYNTTRGNVILGKQTEAIYGNSYITDYMLVDCEVPRFVETDMEPQDTGIEFQISAPSFYQVNSMQAERLYAKVMEYAGLTGNEVVWDLYCGIGTISLFLAQKAKQVYGVEVVPEAIANARENAKRNRITNSQFILGKAEEILPAFYAGKWERLQEQSSISGEDGKEALHPDVIVVDPPRKGCDEKCLDTILQMRPERVVYVSCDPATLARDLKRLCEKEYELTGVTVVDQFCHSVHCECIIKLQRRNM